MTVAVSLAEKLDTLTGFFSIGEKPSGSKDPFALRRSVIGLIRLILTNDLRLPLLKTIRQAARAVDFDDSGTAFDKLHDEMTRFIADRLTVQQREHGVRHDVIFAVYATEGEDDLVRLLARVHALQAFVGTEDGANLLAGYKRAANILKKEEATSPSPPRGEGRGEGESQATSSETAPLPNPLPARGEKEQNGLSYTPEPAESALIAALDIAEPAAAAAVAAEDFEGAMAALATLRAPIDAFFDTVTVNDPDPGKRAQRLSLLRRVRVAVHNVADFSRIEN